MCGSKARQHGKKNIAKGNFIRGKMDVSNLEGPLNMPSE